MDLEDQLNVEKIVRKSKTSFFWGMNILPNNQKRAMFAIYAFCREVDDIADNEKISKKYKKIKLKNWKSNIDKLYSEELAKNFLLRELLFSIQKYNLLKKDFLSIIKGMEMDVKKNIQFPSRKELNLYCDRVAVSVGNLSIKVFGIHSDIGRNYAKYLGRAFQLTNIVRDFHEDFLRKRCYISSEHIKNFRIKKKLNELPKSPDLQNIFQLILNEADQLFLLSDKTALNLNKKKNKNTRNDEIIL